ncbi:MAG: serine hydrolase [Sphingomonas sp. 28-66-16]|nr:MAG: serine hydrolase [Sphingomonas sp. 28-66-16]
MRLTIRATTGLALAALAILATPAAAQQAHAPTRYDMAVAAGYKAAITCSAALIGGRTQAQIAEDELHGIYPEYDAIVHRLDARIDVPQGRVTVGYGEGMPPRIAQWSPVTGCTTLPIGTVPVPRVAGDQAITPRPVAANPAPWPLGDSLPRIAMMPLPPVAAAFDALSYGKGSKTTGVVVVRGNRIVAERYADGFGPFVANRTWSVAKSITGTLIGIAVGEGAIKVDQPAPIAAWHNERDPRQQITIDNLMRMASGLHSDTAGNRTDAVYFGGTTVDENVVQWPLEAKPGTRFRYANNDILLAMLSLRSALGEERYRYFPRDALFDKIGMHHTVAETDWHGNYIASSQIWTTARDLARFGMLYLNDGVWNGRRVLPEGWVKRISTPSGPQPAGAFGYGATFWLLDKSPGVPADAYGAFGNRGQYVVIVPSRGIVIVRRGEDPTGATFDIARFTADILAAMK